MRNKKNSLTLCTTDYYLGWLAGQGGQMNFSLTLSIPLLATHLIYNHISHNPHYVTTYTTYKLLLQRQNTSTRYESGILVYSGIKGLLPVILSYSPRSQLPKGFIYYATHSSSFSSSSSILHALLFSLPFCSPSHSINEYMIWNW